MTLVVSWVASVGIVMAGDSATTYSGGRRPIVRFDAMKVLPIARMRAGISTWGEGQIGDLPVDVWLERWFEDRVVAGDTIETVSQRLVDCLNYELRLDTPNPVIADRPLGLHVSGWLPTEAGVVPVLWHIHRGHAGEAPRELRLHRDYPESGFANPDYPWDNYDEYLQYLSASSSNCIALRNGTYRPFAAYQERLFRLLSDLNQVFGLGMPEFPTLEWWGEFIQFQVQTMVKLYHLYDGLEIIGGTVPYLLIPLNGPLAYYRDGVSLTPVEV